jgi:hypothetical protein
MNYMVQIALFFSLFLPPESTKWETRSRDISSALRGWGVIKKILSSYLPNKTFYARDPDGRPEGSIYETQVRN